MDINENGTFDVREKAEVNVQVVAKPEKPYIDSSKLKNGDYMFSSTYGTDLSLLENLDVSNIVTASYFCSNRKDFTEDMSIDLNFENCTNLLAAFDGCNVYGTVRVIAPKNKELTSFIRYSQNVKCIDLGCTEAVEKWNQAFNGSKVETISELDFKNAKSYPMVLFCSNLKNVTFKNLTIFDNNFSVAQSPQLTVESLLSLFNALSDNTELATTYTVHLGSANIAKLTFEQLSIAYDKNIDLD